MECSLRSHDRITRSSTRFVSRTTWIEDMPRTVNLSVDVESDDWRRPEFYAPDGVLSGYVYLRVRGRDVLSGRVCGLNNSAISLVRSALRDHVGATEGHELEAEWPLFFCAGALRNRCGVLSDFSVRHRDGSVVLTDFLNCKVPRRTRFVLSSSAWAATVEEFGRAVMRRLPVRKKGVITRYQRTYGRYRCLLRRDLDIPHARHAVG